MELRDRYIDPVTHQMVSLDEILVEYENAKIHNIRFYWFKFFLPAFARLLETFSSPKLDALACIFKSMDQRTNVFKKTYTEIMKETEVSSATLASLMLLLQEGDFIRSSGVSSWMVNPALMYAGGDARGRTLAYEYNKLPKPITRKAVKKKFDERSAAIAASAAKSLAEKLSELISKGGDDEDVYGV